MIIVNPQKITKAEIVVGIPSYNEAERIGFVVEQVSLGLQEYFPNKTKVIINTDGHSTDGTKEVFFQAKSALPRIYIAPDKKVRGKGYGLHDLFLMIKELGAQAGLTFDADLKSIQPEWIGKMTQPILDGYDLATPYYARFEDDATITNHFVYPLVYGLFGWDIRQPIGGDFAFSDKMIEIWLKEKWSAATFKFGIDIFMSLNAFFTEMKTCQVNLGIKVHKTTGLAGLGSMFSQVAEALFEMLLANQAKLKNKTEVNKAIILEGEELPVLTDVRPDPQPFRKLSSNQINQKLWAKIVYDSLTDYKKGKKAVIEELGCSFFGRVASFFEKTSHSTPQQSEEAVIKQAQYFFNQRDYFLKKVMRKSDFEKLVNKAVLDLPKHIRQKMDNVEVVVEEKASHDSLLGLYQGVPQTTWGRGFGNILPDKITIFQKSIERVAKTEKEIIELIKNTVWHEIAHHFGFSEKGVRELEARRKKQ